MEISANWIAAIASVASAAVVAVTAVAAFLQIRHVRNSNEITVFLKLVERLDSLEAEAAFFGIDGLVARVRGESELRRRLAAGERIEEFREIASLLQFLEHLSTLLFTGRVTEQLVLAEYADNISDLWDRLAETIYLWRVTRGPFLGGAFEHLAMRAKQYIAAGEMTRLYGKMQKDPRMAHFDAREAVAIDARTSEVRVGKTE